MILCKVCSRLEAETVIPGLKDVDFAVLKADDDTRFVAADPLNAPPESHVLVCRGEAAHAMLGAKAPVDAAVIAII